MYVLYGCDIQGLLHSLVFVISEDYEEDFEDSDSSGSSYSRGSNEEGRS